MLSIADGTGVGKNMRLGVRGWRQGVGEPASLRPEDDDQPGDDGWYDKKLDRKVRRLNRSFDGRYTVGDFIGGLLGAIGDALSGM